MSITIQKYGRVYLLLGKTKNRKRKRENRKKKWRNGKPKGKQVHEFSDVRKNCF